MSKSLIEKKRDKILKDIENKVKTSSYQSLKIMLSDYNKGYKLNSNQDLKDIFEKRINLIKKEISERDKTRLIIQPEKINRKEKTKEKPLLKSIVKYKELIAKNEDYDVIMLLQSRVNNFHKELELIKNNSYELSKKSLDKRIYNIYELTARLNDICFYYIGCTSLSLKNRLNYHKENSNTELMGLLFNHPNVKLKIIPLICCGGINSASNTEEEYIKLYIKNNSEYLLNRSLVSHNKEYNLNNLRSKNEYAKVKINVLRAIEHKIEEI